jgi:hypothetical protein
MAFIKQSYTDSLNARSLTVGAPCRPAVSRVGRRDSRLRSSRVMWSIRESFDRSFPQLWFLSGILRRSVRRA